MHTVKQLSKLAGVSVRTLHYYDEIGLLKPASIGVNGYRYYDSEALLRLQQILFYREMGFDLSSIKKVIDDPDFDRVTALQSHRHALQQEIERLNALIQTVDSTILYLVGEIHMSEKKIFAGFSPEKQRQYNEEAIQMWGEGARQSIKRWNRYSGQEKDQIMQEGNAIYADLLASMDKGAESPEVQAVMVRWHQHMRHFYEPTPDVLRGLGEMYEDHPDFNATFSALHPEFPGFLK